MRSRTLSVLFAALLLAACGQEAGAPATASTPDGGGDPGKADGLGGSCLEFTKPVLVGEIGVSKFEEVSGAAASRRTASVLWVHEDRGNGERLLAVTRTGELVAEVTLPGAENVDWEDLALVSGEDGDFLVIADTGDKDRERETVTLLRFPEPTLSPDSPSSEALEATKFDTYTFAYDDGAAHNAQAMVVEPASGDVYVITARGSGDGSTLVFQGQAPWRLNAVNRLERVLSEEDVSALDVRIVGADVAADRLALLADDGRVMMWAWPAGATIARALKGKPCIGPKVPGEHGAIALTADGRGYTLIPEGGRPDILFVEPKISCPSASEPDKLGDVDARRVREISGAVVSREYEDLIWAQNDGPVPVLLAFDFSGDVVAELEIEGLELEDQEDIAIGPDGAGRDVIYLADTGDNGLTRETVRIVRLPEPDLTVAEPAVDPTTVEVFELAYDDGDAHDTEALIVDPITGDLYVITKAQAGDTRTQVFVARAPLVEGAVQPLHQVLTDRYAPNLVGRVTAADISPLGDRLIVAFKGDEARLWPRDPSRPLWEALQRKGCEVPGGKGQIESIAFGEDGIRYFMVSEGKSPPVLSVELE